jgi:hypothetical protein
MVAAGGRFLVETDLGVTIDTGLGYREDDPFSCAKEIAAGVNVFLAERHMGYNALTTRVREIRIATSGCTWLNDRFHYIEAAREARLLTDMVHGIRTRRDY